MVNNTKLNNQIIYEIFTIRFKDISIKTKNALRRNIMGMLVLLVIVPPAILLIFSLPVYLTIYDVNNWQVNLLGLVTVYAMNFGLFYFQKESLLSEKEINYFYCLPIPRHVFDRVELRILSIASIQWLFLFVCSLLSFNFEANTFTQLIVYLCCLLLLYVVLVFMLFFIYRKRLAYLFLTTIIFGGIIQISNAFFY
jgi:hypothetical protein